MTDFARARKTMVDNQLRTSGITDRRVLGAMGEIPRELFVPESRRALAYIDDAVPLAGERILGAPAPFAKLVQLAAITHTDRVLDVGCGTGYSTAVLAQLAAHVVGVESDSKLATEARSTLGSLALANVEIAEGPLATAGAASGPYDAIVIEGAVTKVPEALFAQLKTEGRLVASVSDGAHPPVAYLFAKSDLGLAASAAFDARLPALEAARDEQFVF